MTILPSEKWHIKVERGAYRVLETAALDIFAKHFMCFVSVTFHVILLVLLYKSMLL